MNSYQKKQCLKCWIYSLGLLWASVNLGLQSVAAQSGSDRIAFASYRQLNRHEIYIMEADGSNPLRLTYNEGWDFAPQYDPKLGKIIFESNRTNPNDGNVLYMMNTDGTDQQPFAGKQEVAPVFSLDGKKIAFSSACDLFVINADGSDLMRLTHNKNNLVVPLAFSADGGTIIFDSRGRETGIYRINVNGTGRILLAEHAVSAWRSASISPRGDKIVFQSDRDGNAEIYTMNIDGTRQRNLSRNSANDHDPVFSPDGSQIAFASFRDENWEIYVMNVDGSGLTRLTHDTTDDHVPCWIPGETLPSPEHPTPSLSES